MHPIHLVHRKVHAGAGWPDYLNCSTKRGAAQIRKLHAYAAQQEVATHLPEADVHCVFPETPTAQHHVVLADQTVVVAALAAARGERRRG